MFRRAYDTNNKNRSPISPILAQVISAYVLLLAILFDLLILYDLLVSVARSALIAATVTLAKTIFLYFVTTVGFDAQ